MYFVFCCLVFFSYSIFYSDGDGKGGTSFGCFLSIRKCELIKRMGFFHLTVHCALEYKAHIYMTGSGNPNHISKEAFTFDFPQAFSDLLFRIWYLVLEQSRALVSSRGHLNYCIGV